MFGIMYLIILCPSLTELQNARGIMDVLTEMLSALDPENKEVSLQYGCKAFHISLYQLIM